MSNDGLRVGPSPILVTAPIVKTGNVLSFDASNLPALTAAAYLATPAAPAYATSVALDVAAKSDHNVGLLTGNITFTFANPADGRSGFIRVKQDGTGGRTVTFTAPATYTIIKDVGVADLSPQSALNTITRYTYLMYALGGTNYLEIAKAYLA
jgi:hypothetical protein